MQKGITPVIAIILLLLITISIVGFSFMFFQRTTETASQSGEEQLKQQTASAGTQLRIEGASGNKVYIRNVGGSKIDKSALGFYADGAPKTVASATVDPLPPGQAGEYQLNDFLATTAETIKVTSGGFGDTLKRTIRGSCKEIKDAGESTGDGVYKLSSATVFNAYCDMTTDGGGWTIVAAYSGADGEEPLVSDIEKSGNPLSFQHYNINRQKKMSLAAVSRETIFKRDSGIWIRVNSAIFDGSLGTTDTHTHKAVTATASNDASAVAYIGYSNYQYGGGGDFGITTSAGFDHHSLRYFHLNGGCANHYLYSYSGVSADGDAGYDVNTALGSWTVVGTNTCNANEGGSLKFYAAMR